MKNIVNYIETFDLQLVPNEVVKRAKYILLDSIGVMYNEAQPDIYKQTLLNGLKMVSNELDEGNSLAKGHPACHYLPMLLEMKKTLNCSDEEFLQAFIVGYEVGARFGEIITLKSQIHPHANWGVLGGAAAIAKLNGWQSEKIEQALTIAAQIVYPTLWTSVLEGNDIRNALIGLMNVNLLLLPTLVENNITASSKTLSVLFSEILGSKIDLHNFNDSKETFYVLNSYFKFYDSCRFCHGPIDAVKAAVRKSALKDSSKIQAIQIDTYESAAKLNNAKPNNDFAAKFSIPYAVSKEVLTLLNEPVNDEKISFLASKVKINSTDEMNALLPEIRGTKLQIEADEKTTTVFIEGAIGQESIDEIGELIVNKFKFQMKSYWPENKIDTFIEHMIEEGNVLNLN